jgi:hypothetical protein
MQIGDRIFQVRWRNGRPYIHTGRVVEAGRRKKKLMALWDGEDKKRDLPDQCGTMLGAIEDAIIANAHLLAPDGLFNLGKRKPRPWLLVEVIADLNRLYVKLRRHHLCASNRGRP